ncbi:hypothetical protein HW555_012661 [Spodoptera exigua]|uniref:Uncharacterized protein n=1 Tax=Spodoptera exigua TaxID=7107 RepID=A0A835G664_SPOEX|nr:hypothetical protein HW555_012661 [Spodoptera exigua]
MGDTDEVRAMFCPRECRVLPYGEVEIRVVLEARRVCGRRVFVFRGRVLRALAPLYLLVDAAVAGVKVSCEVPLGGAPEPDSFVVIPRMQKEECTPSHAKPSTPAEIFAAEDRKRQAVRESTCRCPFEMVYNPPARTLAPPGDGEEQLPVEIVWTPPPLTRVCPCERCAGPRAAPRGPICLQYCGLPLRTVRTRTVLLRNESVVTARWSTAVRRWPRQRCRTLATEEWAAGAGAAGVALQCAPARGVLAAHARASLRLSVYADCWGLYHDQLLILIDDVEPIVLDVWIEAVGPPLQLAINAITRPEQSLDVAPTMWMSASDARRKLRGRNVSRAPLLVHAYTAASYEYPQDELPFRLYIRYYDVPPRTCACVTAFQTEEGGDVEEADTGLELYLAPDCGPQTDAYYAVSPEVCTVQAGECADWQLRLVAPQHGGERAPDVCLLLRLQPLQAVG